MAEEIIPVEQVSRRILHIRGEKVLLDFDLAVLYSVGVKVLNQVVKRNRDRFPETQLLRSQLLGLENRQVAENEGTETNWSQIVTSSQKYRGTKYRPYAFTEEGVAMLSNVLKSKRAVKVNIAIMRAFVKLRQTLDANRQLAQKFSELEQRVEKHDAEIAAILEAIRQLMAPPKGPRREIGFHVREKAPRYRARTRG
jgi:phage regulator Rha-like protein